ncbi:MAG: N-acetylmuramoyl-L-alanine amidase [Candidatus Omnitrophica bacterium]|nr:N-acetylmuramoyl-L-alanine amidase [Candidatus Omnitrophota bacterium]
MSTHKNRTITLLMIFVALFLSSCARAPMRHTDLGTMEPYPTIPGKIVTAPDVSRGDIYHEVGPGETVWRISKMYDVNLKDIVLANNLKDAAVLEKGQKLLIPNAAPLVSVIPLYPSRKWDYIIVHHSATDVGNALNFDNAHQKRRWKGLGYHFVIDNGTSGKNDGQVEVSPRWIHQEDGAHCKADGMNYRGIGICLVGNFSTDSVSQKQLRSLTSLVNNLKKYYNIPNSRILGHGQVKGAATECPGLKFPWSEFRSQLEP